MKARKVKSNKANIFVIENFLGEEECNKLIDKIEKKPIRSRVYGGKFKAASGVTTFRTSSTASMNPRGFPYIEKIDKRISRHLNIPIQLGEITQGQRYLVGQEFKDHYDFFGKGSMKGHGEKWGNRTWTFMIYLNDDLEGGETHFSALGIKFKPKRGMAVYWQNMDENGVVNKYTKHAGRPVIEGKKYIITKWFREKPTGTYKQDSYFKQKYPKLSNSKYVPATKIAEDEDKKVFSGHHDFPKFTEVGFKLIDVPKDVWDLIKDTYKLLKNYKKPEKFENQLNVIYDKDKKTSPVDILSLAHAKSVKAIIHEKLQPILEEWSGQNITPTMIYGIRSYKNGAILTDHKDRPKTHHISAIIIVDEKSNKPWPLDIQSHDGKWHKVYAKPGQMILYESCACQHGRLEEFDGEYFRNFFVHYKLNDWTFVPNKQNKKLTSALE